MQNRVPVRQNVLSRNDELAQELRRRWDSAGVLCLNLISAPGSGKTALLEQTLARLQGRVEAAVLVGDLQTDNDARRLARYAFPVRQITTGGTCHLDAAMVARHVEAVAGPGLELLIIENVGNLVCPGAFDLGEDAKVVLLSTTEGDDKPQKYPGVFRRAGAMVLTKADLLGLTDFDVHRAVANALALNPRLQVFRTSSRTGEGLDLWCDWIRAEVAAKRARACAGLPGAARPAR